MFLYKNLFFSISSVISIPIMLIGINGGYFPAICRVCLVCSFPRDEVCSNKSCTEMTLLNNEINSALKKD